MQRSHSGSSERDHLREMICHLPRQSLITADAGFTGHAYWRELLDAGHDFIIRVGANVTLLQNLGNVRELEQNVYLWSEDNERRHVAPLRLRLVVIPNKRPIYLVTSVLDESKLIDKQIALIYRARWGVELYYRSVKQTFERRKLRSHNFEHALCELDWSLVGLWAVTLFARLQQHERESRKLSVAKALRAIRQPMREYKSKPDAGEDLWTLINLAVTSDNRQQRKTNPDYPRKKKREAIGSPVFKQATKKQRQKAMPLLEADTKNSII